MKDIMLHFCCLEAEKIEDGHRPVISKTIEELGITNTQAEDIAREMHNANLKTIACWITGEPEE